MTREEAAEILKNVDDNIKYDAEYGVYFTHEWVGAYEMAIAALREPKLPCKPGDTVYRLCGQRGRKYVAERKVVSVALCGEQSWQILTTVHDWLGHTVFLTREDAEVKLRRLEDACSKD